MNYEATTAQPVIQPTDFRNAVIRSLLKESNALKLKIEHLEMKEKAMEELQSENRSLKTRIEEWRQLSNKVGRLEERIASMLYTEREDLKIQLVKQDARIGEVEAKVGRVAALVACISGLLQWKSQHEQDTREKAVELEGLKKTIQELQADATNWSREAARLQDEGIDRASLTGIANEIKDSLQSIENANREVVECFKDFTKNVGGLSGRLGLESLYLLMFLCLLNKIWDWCSAYLANYAATRTSVSVDDKAQG